MAPMNHSATSISEAAARRHINSQAGELTSSHPMCQAPRTEIQSVSAGTPGSEHTLTDRRIEAPCNRVTLDDALQT